MHSYFTSQINGIGFFKNMPQEMLCEVGKYLSDEDIATLRRVSRDFHGSFKYNVTGEKWSNKTIDAVCHSLQLLHLDADQSDPFLLFSLKLIIDSSALVAAFPVAYILETLGSLKDKFKTNREQNIKLDNQQIKFR